MFEVVVDVLRYIQGVPVELTESAVSSGELRRGSVVGLLVHPVGEPGNVVLVEVRLDDAGQAGFVKPGLAVMLDGSGSRLRFASDWVRLLAVKSGESLVESPADGSLGPDPGVF